MTKKDVKETETEEGRMTAGSRGTPPSGGLHTKATTLRAHLLAKLGIGGLLFLALLAWSIATAGWKRAGEWANEPHLAC
jgi:hypothetical protein